MATAEQFTLLSIGLCTITVRVYMRWRSVGLANWQLDDYVMPLVGVSLLSSIVHGRLQMLMLAFNSLFSLRRLWQRIW
jgi:hypothetical protein